MGLLLREKQAKVFIFLKSRESAYLSEIAKETGTTYVYITNFAYELQQKGIVTLQKEGKKNMVRLTQKGKEAATLAEELRRKLE